MGLTRIRAQQISDIDYKQAVRVITTTHITLSGGAPSLVDGVSLLTGDRVLVNGQSSGSQNGIYIVQTLGTGGNGTWVRSTDANATGEIQAGMIIMVTEGAVHADTQWKLITNDPITVGVTSLSFVINSASLVGGNNTEIQFNDSGSLAGSSNLTWSNNQLYVNGSSNITGNLNTGNFGITGDITGNMLPAANVAYDLGSSSQRWRDIWLSNSTIHLGEAQISANATSLIFSNPLGAETVFTGVSSDIEANTVTVTGDITAANFVGNGSQLTGLPEQYGNANVASYLPTYGGNIGANNITGTSFSGQDLDLTGSAVILGNLRVTGNTTFISSNDLVVGTINVVMANLAQQPSDANGAGVVVGNVTGNTYATMLWNSTSNTWVVSRNIQSNAATFESAAVSGNISASYFLGNGSQLTGLPQQYSNANVAAYLPTYSGNVGAGNVTVSGNISASYVLGNGSQLTGLPEQYGNANVAQYLPTYSGNISASNVTASGNITAARFLGNGSSLTGMYSNTNVATYLPTYTGNITAGVVVATGNVSAGNLTTTGVVSATGNVTAGNVTTAGQVTANGNVTGSNFTTSATGTVTTGNVLPTADNTGVVGTAARTWSNGQFTNLTVDTTLTVTNTLNVRAAIDLGDNDILRFGDADDWEMYHSGVNNFIDLTVGDLLIRDDGTAGDPTRFTFGRLTGDLTAAGNVTANNFLGNINTTGNITSLANVSAGNVTAVANITGENFVGTTLDISGNALFTGNLRATGNVTLVNSNDLEVGNLHLILAANAQQASDANSAGILLGNESAVIFGSIEWRWTNNTWAISNNVQSNTATFSTLLVSGNATANGDIAGSNISANGTITATGTATAGNLLPATDNTGVVGTAARTWNNGQFTDLTVDSTLSVRAAIDLADSDILRFGSSDDWELYHNGVDNYMDLTVGNLLIRDDGTTGDPTRFTFERLTGNLTATGNISGNYILGNGSELTGMYGNDQVAAYLPTYTGNVSAGNVTVVGTVSASQLLGNGSQLTGMYGNDQVAAYLPTYSGDITAGNITVSGNVTGAYILGNGSQLSGMPEPYSNANVSAYLPVYSGNINSSGLTTGNISGGNISVLGNATAAYFSGNGSQLSGMYGNANVAAYLPTYTGVLTAASVTASGNITAAYFQGNGSQLTGMYGNATVATYLPTYTGNITANTITAAGNVSGIYILGNGSQLTGMPAAYTNANVAAYLPTYTGNISAGNVTVAGTVRAANIDSVNADLAERYLSDQHYEPGTVVVFGGDAEITQSQRYADSRVAGVISTAPAYSMNSAAPGLPVALQGRVPCRVQGMLRRGDLVTTSNTAGVATRLRPQDWVPGAVIGKALADHNSDDVGVIEVVVGRL